MKIPFLTKYLNLRAFRKASENFYGENESIAERLAILFLDSYSIPGAALEPGFDIYTNCHLHHFKGKMFLYVSLHGHGFDLRTPHRLDETKVFSELVDLVKDFEKEFHESRFTSLLETIKSAPDVIASKVRKPFEKDFHNVPSGTEFNIVIPKLYHPLDRLELFEDPLIEAFETEKLGSIIGGGTMMGDSNECSNIEVVVADAARGLEVMRDVLIQQDAPDGTLLIQLEPETIEHTLHNK